MAKKEMNTRCPLQAECERKCSHEGHELNCDYYRNNAFGEDRTIPDQEDIRRQQEEELEAAIIDEELAETKEGDTFVHRIAVPDGLVYIPVSKLRPHPDNPRKDLGDLTELAESIKANGVFQNLTVVPHLGEITKEHSGLYTVIIGHRRLAAAKLIGLKELPCIVVDMSEREQLSTMLVENMQRVDLTIYEQAQGFQMMLDLGDTMDEIAEKSGFSKSTVRKRLEIAKLDSKALKKASTRQLTLGDFDELAKVDDIEARNKLLSSIGTANFKNELSNALQKQKLAKRMEEWLAVIQGFATEDPEASYQTKRYVCNYGYYNISKDVVIPEDADTVKYYYKLTEREIDIYKDRDIEKENAEEEARKEKNRLAAAEREKFQDITSCHFELREEFVKNLSSAVCKKNIGIIACFFANTMLKKEESGYSYLETDFDVLAYCLGIKIDIENLEDDKILTDIEGVANALETHPEKAIMALAYCVADDADTGYWHSRWNNGQYEYYHKENPWLDTIYRTLSTLGYEMSDEEKAMQDGTHEFFGGNDDETAAES